MVEWLDGEMEEIDATQTLDVEDTINLESSTLHAILAGEAGIVLATFESLAGGRTKPWTLRGHQFD